MQDEQKISYKYDLMHRNTPKFARTTIEWDTKLMTPLTKKRLIKCLKQGFNEYGHGDTGQMYQALVDKFEVPDVIIPIEGQQSSIRFKYVPDYVWEEANKIHIADQVMTRMSDAPSWWRENPIDRNCTGFWIRNKGHDFTDFKKACERMMKEDIVAKRVKEALMFVEEGGVLRFTYNPNNR